MENEIKSECDRSNVGDFEFGFTRQFNKMIMCGLGCGEQGKVTDYVVTGTTIKYPYGCFFILINSMYFT